MIFRRRLRVIPCISVFAKLSRSYAIPPRKQCFPVLACAVPPLTVGGDSYTRFKGFRRGLFRADMQPASPTSQVSGRRSVPISSGSGKPFIHHPLRRLHVASFHGGEVVGVGILHLIQRLLRTVLHLLVAPDDNRIGRKIRRALPSRFCVHISARRSIAGLNFTGSPGILLVGCLGRKVVEFISQLVQSKPHFSFPFFQCRNGFPVILSFGFFYLLRNVVNVGSNLSDFLFNRCRHLLIDSLASFVQAKSR